LLAWLRGIPADEQIRKQRLKARRIDGMNRIGVVNYAEIAQESYVKRCVHVFSGCAIVLTYGHGSPK
jgi:hypothetical protein